MEITYNSAGFDTSKFGNKLKGTSTLNFTPEELIWAAITVGRKNIFDVIKHGIYSEFEIMYRISILFANLSKKGDRLIKSNAFKGLDPSEKGAISYFLGMVFSKLMADRVLGVPFLMHLDVYHEQLEKNGVPFVFGNNRSKPDLIGYKDDKGWLVMEAKGRTNKMESWLLRKAKEQTQNLRYIDKKKPWLRVGAVTHFSRGELKFNWEDPEGSNKDAFDLNTTNKEFLFNYYELVFNLISKDGRGMVALPKDGRAEIRHSFQTIGLSVSMDLEIYEALQKKDHDLLLRGYRNYKEFRENTDGEKKPDDKKEPDDKNFSQGKDINETEKRDNQQNNGSKKSLTDNRYFYQGNDGISISTTGRFKEFTEKFR